MSKLAVEHLKRMKGGSQPQLIRCDDGYYYVVKFLNNPQGAGILANEMLATKLALALGLPVAEPAVVEVSEWLVEHSPEMYLKKGGRRYRCAAGLQFGSRFVCDPLLTPAFDFLPDVYLERVVNRDSFLGMLVFDMWTCNSDSRQVVFHRPGSTVFHPEHEGPSSRYKATMIDQGHCFNASDWSFLDKPWQGISSRRCVFAGFRVSASKISLQQFVYKPGQGIYSRRRVYAGGQGLDSLAAFLERLENLDAGMLREVADSVPPEWYGGKRDEIRRLLRELAQRGKVITEMILKCWASNPETFPCWEYGSQRSGPEAAQSCPSVVHCKLMPTGTTASG